MKRSRKGQTGPAGGQGKAPRKKTPAAGARPEAPDAEAATGVASIRDGSTADGSISEESISEESISEESISDPSISDRSPDEARVAAARKTAAGDGRRGNFIVRLARGWVAFWNRREPATGLVLVRILVGAVLLGDLLQSWSYGLVPTIWGPPPEGLGWGGRGMGASAVGRWFGASVDTAWLLWGAGVLVALFVIFGVLTRISCLLLALAWAQLGWMAPDSDRGIDFLLRSVLIVLAMSPCHSRWSVDAWFRRKIGRPFAELQPAWTRYVLILQTLWVYFSAGHNKTDGAWGPLKGYSALANILTDPHFARFEATWIKWFYPLLQVATGLTMVFELGSVMMLPLLYWSATRGRPGFLRKWANKLRLRWIWIFLGVQFHIGIGVTMRLGIFPWGMMALYPVLFHPEELARAEAWVTARLSRFRSRSIARGSPAA